MRQRIFLLILLFTTFYAQAATDIVLSKNIKPALKKLIIHDLENLDHFQFRANTDARILEVLGINNLNSETINAWLSERVKYIIDQDAFSKINLKVKKVLTVESENVNYPNQVEQLPLQGQKQTQIKTDPASIIMTNIGAQYYIQGKQEHKLYAIKIFPNQSDKTLSMRIDSPRAGIIQIGAGLFSPGLAINRTTPNAFSNSIFRLTFLLHEARHSDGNGKSLGFAHSICPRGHDYEGELACDESANGAYTVGALMAREMMLSCDQGCSEREKEMLKIFILDNFNRVQIKQPALGSSNNWDVTPEEL